MGSEMVDEMFMQNLEEFVYDESKLVTYKWLSQTLEVHVNVAKQMLFAFMQHQRNKKDNDNLAVTYAVAGQAADKHGNLYNKVQVVREEDLEATKSQLKKVVSCHVYSIQKSKLQDTNALYTIDYTAFKEDIYLSNRFSSISCSNAKCRNMEELESLRKTVMPTQKEPAFSAEKESLKHNGTTKAKNGTSTNGKQAGIAGMFSNAKPKTSKANEGEKETPKTQPKSEDKPASKQSKSVVSFFSNHAVKPKKEPAPTEPSKESVTESESKQKSTNKDVQKTEKKTTRKKAVESDEEDPLPQKKRRRIKQQGWESSSEEEDEMDVEEPIPPPRSPTPPPREPSPSSPIPPTPQEETRSKKIISENKVKGKRRKRVQKSKSYMNEEGYFVTEKVWESEYSDCSDDEVVVLKEETNVKVVSPAKTNENTTKKKVNEEKKKKSPPASKKGKAASNSKQMSMMNFFKKQ